MTRFMTIAVGALLAMIIFNSETRAEDASEIMKKSHLAYYYAGDDGIADVTMRITDKRRERVKEFSMLRLDLEEGGRQKYYTYFKKPSDVARLTFMVHKTPEASDARWIYVPSVDLVKPISADDKNSSFVGSDFTYEDVSGRHWTEDNHVLLADSTVDGRAVYVIESTPKAEYKGFARKISYIDKNSLLPLLEVYYDKRGTLIRIFRSEKIEEIDGITTVTQRSMEDLKKERKTTIEFARIEYNQGIGDDIFTERYLRTPPRQYIK
jgi:outer membrane lipoprotein-sorting protein